MRAFWRGFLSAFTICPSRRIARIKPMSAAELQQLAWQRVGNSMRTAMRRFPTNGQ